MKEKYVAGIDTITCGYSIPFSQKKADGLHKYCTERTAYVIQKGYHKLGTRIRVDTAKDWRDGIAEELFRFGHIASSYERQVLADEKAGKIQQQLPPAKSYG